MPLSFWGDCVLTAIYLINRLPSLLFHNTSLYELLFNKIPSYSHHRTFRCLYFATNTSPNKHKFTPRARKSMFLGHAFNTKGYKLFDLQTHSIFIFRDVIFHETIFPFSKSPPSSFSSSPSLIPLPNILLFLLFTLILLFPHLFHLLLLYLMTLSLSFIMILMKVFKNILMLLMILSSIRIHQIILSKIKIQMSLEDLPDHLNLHLTFRHHCNQVASALISNLIHIGTSHPLSSILSYDNLLLAYKTFCCSISTIIEPTHYS